MRFTGIKYKKEIKSDYKIRHINAQQTIDYYGKILRDYFNKNDLEDEVILMIGEYIDKNTKRMNLDYYTREKMEKFDDLLLGTKPGERIGLYYHVFEPMKLRQMKIDKILNGK